MNDPEQKRGIFLVEHLRDLAAMCGERQYHDALHAAADELEQKQSLLNHAAIHHGVTKFCPGCMSAARVNGL